MGIEHEGPPEPGRASHARSTREATDPLVTMVIRAGFFLIMSSLAIVLAYNGRNAIRDRHFDNRWTTTTSTSLNGDYTAHASRTEHGEELLDGAPAVRFGIGLLAAAAMLTEWSVGIAISTVRRTKAADRPKWTAMHTLATSVSLACLLTALVLLLPPPEHIGRRLFTSVFYGTILVISVVLVAAVLINRPRFAALIFPAIALAAVFISPLASGIIFGFFAWLSLATHVVLLVPTLRQRALLVK